MKITELINALSIIDQDQITKLYDLVINASQVIMIGNGGSNSICSHISQDYTKQLKKKAFTFSDPSRLTCYINDYGTAAAYAKFLEEFYLPKTLIILISSSGESDNILRCAKYCVDNRAKFVILSGFDINNSLRSAYSYDADLELWVDSEDYGVVENTHQAFLHAIVGDIE